MYFVSLFPHFGWHCNMYYNLFFFITAGDVSVPQHTYTTRYTFKWLQWSHFCSLNFPWSLTTVHANEFFHLIIIIFRLSYFSLIRFDIHVYGIRCWVYSSNWFMLLIWIRLCATPDAYVFVVIAHQINNWS